MISCPDLPAPKRTRAAEAARMGIPLDPLVPSPLNTWATYLALVVFRNIPAIPVIPTIFAPAVGFRFIVSTQAL